jgi:hypothetical protein
MTEGEPGSGMTLRAGILLVGAAALGVAGWLYRAPPKTPAAPAAPQARAPMPVRLQPEALTPADANREAAPVADGYRREVARPKPVQSAAGAPSADDEGQGDAQDQGLPAHRRETHKALPEIFRMPGEPAAVAAQAAASPAPVRGAQAPALADEFAPFGRLVKCQLVDTLDSATSRPEPIVALVTEDLDWNGTVIIPAGTEAFSYAKPEAVMDAGGVGRLVDDGEWTLVLPASQERPNGRELILRGRAVDRREVPSGTPGPVASWGLDDGADGLVGYTLSTLDSREIKLFAAAAVGGMAQGFAAIAERQQPAAGIAGAIGATQIAPTLGNAATGALGAGAAELMTQMAARIRDEISRRGAYVRVPAGKEFYLFVEQTIDPRSAAVGLRLPARREASR